jgi:hypothetical protein
MSNPPNDPKFNETLKRMLAQPPKQNKDLKLVKETPKTKKAPKSWSWPNKD